MRQTTYRDPVCGRKLNRGKAHIALDYQGVTYYLCCPKCQSEFEARPQLYARPEYGKKARSDGHVST